MDELERPPCSSCLAWHPTRKDKGTERIIGECRMDCPRFDAENYPRRVWPEVYDNEWCCQFEPLVEDVIEDEEDDDALGDAADLP